jgi:hypothetical protein
MQNFKRVMTGAEAYRTAMLFIKKCAEVSGDEYADFLWRCLDTDPALMGDWDDCIQEVLRDREEVGNKKLVNAGWPIPVFKDCGCWEKAMAEYQKGKKECT